MTLGAPGEATAFPGAAPSSALGPDADILAFLQAMVDASSLADAGAHAIDSPAPAPSGAPTTPAGTSAARTVASPWHDLFIARDIAARLPLLVRQAMASSSPLTEDGEAADVPVGYPFVAMGTFAPAASTRTKTVSPVVSDQPSPLGRPTMDDDESEATAFLLAAAMQPLTVPVALVPTTAEQQPDAATGKTDETDAVESPSPSTAPLIQPAADVVVTAVVSPMTGVAQPAPVARSENANTVVVDNEPARTAATEPNGGKGQAPSMDAALQSGSDGAADGGVVEPYAGTRSASEDRAPAHSTHAEAADSAFHSTLNTLVSDESAIEPSAASALTAAAHDGQMAADMSGPTPATPSYSPAPAAVAMEPARGTVMASARAHAAMRALRQQMAVVEQAAAPLADQPLIDVLAATAIEPPPGEEPQAWTSLMAQAAAAQAPEAPRVRAADARPVALHESGGTPAHAASAAAVHGVMESVRPVAAALSRRDEHEAPPRGERRSVAPPLGQDVAAAMALTPRFDLEAPLAVAKAAETPAEVRPLPNEAANSASIVRSMHWQYRNGVGTAVVQLDPGYLGEVRVALRVDGHTVTATLHAANAEVRAWMQANEGALRQSLTAQGLSLDTLVIAEEQAMAPRTSPDGRGQSERNPERPRRPRAPTTDNNGRRFEIVV